MNHAMTAYCRNSFNSPLYSQFYYPYVNGPIFRPFFLIHLIIHIMHVAYVLATNTVGWGYIRESHHSRFMAAVAIPSIVGVGS